MHTTPALRALDLHFAVRTDDAVLGRYVEGVFRAFALSAAAIPDLTAATRLYSLSVAPPPGQCSVWLDDQLLRVSEEAAEVVAHLLWDVNRRVVAASSGRHLLVHAGAVEHEGVGLVLPAPMESGKTTLVAGLVQAGLRYMTDEAAAIEVASLLLHPFPKALSVDPGSWGVLAGLRPELEPGAERFVREQWHVDPSVAIRPDAVAASPCRPGYVIAPSYVPGATTALVPMARSEAVVVLARNSFNFHGHAAAALSAAAAVARGSECYRLTVGDLGEACQLVLALISARQR